MSADQFLKQEPRPGCFFICDSNDAAEKVNYLALEHAGKDHQRYVDFLRRVAGEIKAWADETEADLPKEAA